MRNYTTQMDAARKGIITPEISLVAEKEHMDVSKLMTLVAEGKVAICANKNHTGRCGKYAPHKNQCQSRCFP